MPLTRVAGPDKELDRDGCAPFRVTFEGADIDPVVGALRCRRSDQSALLTFVDPDGSLGAAGVLRPRDDTPKAPIVVSLPSPQPIPLGGRLGKPCAKQFC